jgi:anaerobic selenocysteine-containing dehydrogenase
VTTRTAYTACNLCEAICGLVLTVESQADGTERVTAVRGNPDDPLSRGHICPKGVSIADVHDDPDRLRRPVRKQPDGTWEEIGWDEAVAYAVDGLAGVQERHGRDAVAAYLGNPNVHSLGSMTHGTQLAKSLRTRNVYSATSVDQLPQQLMAHKLFGHQLLLPIPDIDRTDLFVVLGANPMASNGSLMTVPDFPTRLRELKARGGRMVVLDPRRTETAKVATEHHFVRPGTDAFVLLAMLHVVLEEERTDVPAYVDGVEALRDAVTPFTPELAQEAAGVDAEVVRGLARDVADAERAAVYGRMGVSTQGFGTVCAWAISCLNIVTGHLDRPGGVMFTDPAVDVVGRGLIGRGGHGRWRSRVRGLPESGGELPVSTLADEMLTPGDGQVRGLLTVAGNPVLSTPDGARLGEAMTDLEFQVAVDIYLNETTRHADVILPPTTALERDHYDLAFHALAVRNTARFSAAALAKPHDARHDWEIFRDLTLGLLRRSDRSLPWKRWAVTQARVRLSPTRVVDALLRSGRRRLSVRSLRHHPQGVDLGPLAPCLPERLMTRSRRVDLVQELPMGDLPRVLALADAGARDDELLLIGRRHQRDNNSWMHNADRLTRGRPRHQLLMHPDDLGARGIADGATVEVASRVGKVRVEVAASEDVMPGVVSLPHGYGHARAEGMSRARELPGVSINDLTDPERLDVSGNAAFNGVPVTVSAG